VSHDRDEQPGLILMGSSLVSIDVVRVAEDVLAAPSGGWVYAIVAPEVLRVKIGSAKEVDDRWDAAMSPMPAVEYQLHSATLHPDRGRAEREAHRQLAHARWGGEWFDMRDAAVEQWLASRETESVANCLHGYLESLERPAGASYASAAEAAAARRAARIRSSREAQA
jgi:hypothetical protein